MARRSWKEPMTTSEIRRGLVFFLLYLFLFPYLNAWLQRLILGDGEVLVAEANVVYYAVLFLMSVFVFWGFLRRDFEHLLDWLPENLFSVVAALAAACLLRAALELLPLPVTDPISQQYAAQFRAAPAPTLFLILALIPVVEEPLFRGLVYGQLRGYSRPLALVGATLLYAVAAVWRYALEHGDPRYLWLILLYLPMSAALTWCYDRGGSVWSCVALHSAINAVTLFTRL